MRDYGDIHIRETGSGPEIVFDGGVQGWVIPATEADLDTLRRVLNDRRRAIGRSLDDAGARPHVEAGPGGTGRCRRGGLDRRV